MSTLNVARLDLAKFAADHLAVIHESSANKSNAIGMTMIRHGFASTSVTGGHDERLRSANTGSEYTRVVEVPSRTQQRWCVMFSSGQALSTTIRVLACESCVFDGRVVVDVDPEVRWVGWVCPLCGVEHELNFDELEMNK